MKSPVTTHVLDTANGHPAKGITVVLDYRDAEGGWVEIARGQTNDDGRITDWIPSGKKMKKGVYRVTFEAGFYFDASGVKPAFYPIIPVVFFLEHPDEHYHIPLLLSPYGYSTYRGS